MGSASRTLLNVTLFISTALSGALFTSSSDLELVCACFCGRISTFENFFFSRTLTPMVREKYHLFLVFLTPRFIIFTLKVAFFCVYLKCSPDKSGCSFFDALLLAVKTHSKSSEMCVLAVINTFLLMFSVVYEHLSVCVCV